MVDVIMMIVQDDLSAPGAMMTTPMPKGFSSRRMPSDNAFRPALLAE